MFQRQGLLNKDDELDLLSEEESPRDNKEKELSKTQKIEPGHLDIKPKHDKESINSHEFSETQPNHEEDAAKEIPDFNKTLPIPLKEPQKGCALNEILVKKGKTHSNHAKQVPQKAIRQKIVLETSKDGPQIGNNISYDASFTKVKDEIFKETVKKQKQNGYKVDDVIMEKPPSNKPKKLGAKLVQKLAFDNN